MSRRANLISGILPSLSRALFRGLAIGSESLSFGSSSVVRMIWQCFLESAYQHGELFLGEMYHLICQPEE